MRASLLLIALCLANPVLARPCSSGLNEQHGHCVTNPQAVRPAAAAAPVQASPLAPAITKPIEAGSGSARASRMSNLHIASVLDGYMLDGDGLSISDVVLDSARYGVTMRKKDGSYGTVSNLTIKRVAITASEAGIYIRGGSHDILIEDTAITCTHVGSGIPGGVKVGTTSGNGQYNIRLNRVLVQGCKGDQGNYEQGDGFAAERPDHDIAITNSVFRDHGDGCIDTKASGMWLDNVVLDDCNYGLRAWAQGKAGTIHVVAVNKAAIQIKPTTDWTIDYLDLGDVAAHPSNAHIGADGAGGRLTVKACSAPVVLTGSKAAVTLGPGCVVRL